MGDRDEPYRIAFVADPVCWTEVPEQFSSLARQRRRWQRGLWEAIVRHRGMLFNPRYGAVGLVAMPYFVLFEFLSPLFALGGLLVTLGLFAVGALGPGYVIAFVVVAVGFSVMLSLAALAIEETGYQRYRRRREVFQLVAYALIEGFGYHQLHDFWRLMGTVDLVRGTSGWGAQQRKGFDAPATRGPGGVRVG
jgi:cellulose synthase/poly-beta-1,6-N-acetylglucosamine synthase-like glycosyltransferase